MLVIVAMTFFGFAHPFYLSVTDLKFNPVEKTLEGSVKIFVNDLEKTLSKIHNQKVDLLHPADKTQNLKLLEEYVQKNLRIRCNGKDLKLHCLGAEVESEACWIFLQAVCDGQPGQVQVENSILYEYFHAQSNIVQLEVNNEKRSGKVNFPDKVLNFSY